MVNSLYARLSKILLGVAFLSVSLLLASCTPQKLPRDAKDALLAYWTFLPSPSAYEYRIIQAWQGAVPAEDKIALPPEMEVWCVETRISAPNDPAVNGEKLIWIVTRETQEAHWRAALLATMSSLWPYEACGSLP